MVALWAIALSQEAVAQECRSCWTERCPALARYYPSCSAAALVPPPSDRCSSAARCEERCQAGSAQACTRLGGFLEAGQAGAPKDLPRALAEYRRGCEGNDAAACARAGAMLREGLGAPRDASASEPWLNKACDLGHADGCQDLGLLLERGEAGKVELARAAASYHRGCEAGAAEACGLEGRMYLWGSGVAAAPEKAAQFFARACDGKHRPSCGMLALLQTRGWGVPADAKRAQALAARAGAAEPLWAPPVPPTGAATLIVETLPPGASVLIDGMRVGVTPLTARVPPGERTVELRFDQRAPRVHTLTLAPNVAQTLRESLPATLRIETRPSGAALTLDGREVGKSPYTATLTRGDHTVVARLAPYAPVQRTFRVLEGETRVETLTLMLEPARLEVDSSPPGAAVLLDGKEVGRTPFAQDVDAGQHTLALRLEGHEPVTRPIRLARGELARHTFTFEMTRRRLSIESTPPGATVRIDSEVKGVTPWSDLVPLGPRTLEVFLAGHAGHAETLTISAADQGVSRKLSLAPSPVTLKVVSAPPGADVLLDGKKVGVTPFESGLTVGTHRLAVALPGYEPPPETGFLAEAGQTIERTFVLTPRLVAVTIETAPSGAELVVDGKPRGPSPAVVALLPGVHRVQARLDGYPAREQPFTLAPGASTTWRLTLDPSVPSEALENSPLPPPAAQP